ncbi:MAG: hypothetical protein Q7O66_23725 [Dehalococcoidia bacterium]|nr:hypothetical protein [Dehalococcoidia bacterium]
MLGRSGPKWCRSRGTQPGLAEPLDDCRDEVVKKSDVGAGIAVADVSCPAAVLERVS